MAFGMLKLPFILKFLTHVALLPSCNERWGPAQLISTSTDSPSLESTPLQNSFLGREGRWWGKVLPRQGSHRKPTRLTFRNLGVHLPVPVSLPGKSEIWQPGWASPHGPQSCCGELLHPSEDACTLLMHTPYWRCVHPTEDACTLVKMCAP